MSVSKNKKTVPQLKDVAKEANVSLTTASIILRNGNGRFHEDTKKRVFQAARELGWQQNLLVQSMQTGKTRTIGVLVPPFDSYWTNVLSGIHQELTDADYMPITLWAGDSNKFSNETQGLEHIRKLIGHRVEGLIAWPDFAETYRANIRELSNINIPFVVIDHALPEKEGVDSVQTDEEQGGKLVAEHLIGLGHKKIACFSEFQKSARSWQLMRTKYFEFAVYTTAKDVEYSIWHLNDDETDGIEVALRMLSDKNRPTAVFAETDHLATDVYNAASELGIKIPQELSVVGFSGLDFTKKMRPPLTTVMQRGIEVGHHAGRMLINRIENKETGSAHTVRVGCDFILRNSTAPPVN
ncbi:Glucose-resistance amylase regulator [Limihaloglobus sulfuriphilus]|uniref:Glucose-resistance amylase regulator n=1 Tax=Limihaloglobus sulfuriphilus TaxID=1851148 RepID=A0A1Q2MBF0_9BACT|nr:LacI family DNA-binding transcriptional regulator [Limihaloglobus sulfuriphilus]AQQ69858.1 Glucose-resistance amylase regulator [Limihaloglobus sulfuriphilus]